MRLVNAIMASPEALALLAAAMQNLNRQAAMREREALLAQLRAHEDMHDLPRSLPTKAERGEAGNTRHHNR